VISDDLLPVFSSSFDIESKTVEPLCWNEFFPVRGGDFVSEDFERLDAVLFSEVRNKLRFVCVQEVIAVLRLNLGHELVALAFKDFSKTAFVE
jgi:hypothetical protein